MESMAIECENLALLVVIIHIANKYLGILVTYAGFLGTFLESLTWIVGYCQNQSFEWAELRTKFWA